MITRYGMDEQLGHVTYDESKPTYLGVAAPIPERKVSEATMEAIDRGVREIIARVFQRAHDMLADNREVLDRCAGELLARETLDADALRRLTEELRREPEAAAGPDD
jgi:cell division protease FtsH